MPYIKPENCIQLAYIDYIGLHYESKDSFNFDIIMAIIYVVTNLYNLSAL